MTQIFISYASENRNIAERLYADLEKEGLKPWLDVKSLLPGTIWKDEIKLQIKNSQFVVLLLSQKSLGKVGYIQKEIRDVLETLDEYPQSKIFLIPVRLEDCQISHNRISEIQWVDLFPSYRSGFKKILKAIYHEIPSVSSSKSITQYKINRIMDKSQPISSSTRRSLFSKTEKHTSPFDEYLALAKKYPKSAVLEAWAYSKKIAAQYLEALKLVPNTEGESLLKLLDLLTKFRLIDVYSKSLLSNVGKIVEGLATQSFEITQEEAEKHIHSLENILEKIRENAYYVFWGRNC